MHPLNLADASICKNGFTPSGTIGGLVKVLGPESRNALRDFKNANGLSKDDIWMRSLKAPSGMLIRCWLSTRRLENGPRT